MKTQHSQNNFFNWMVHPHVTVEELHQQLMRPQVGLEHRLQSHHLMAFSTNSVQACLSWCLSGVEMWVSEKNKSVHLKVRGQDVCEVVVGSPCVCMCGFRKHISRAEPTSLPFLLPSPTSSTHGCPLNSSYRAACTPRTTVLDCADGQGWRKQHGSRLTGMAIRYPS